MSTAKAPHSRPRTHTIAQRRELVTRYRQGSLPLPEFAEAHGLEISTLCQWLRGPDTTPGPERFLFQEVLLPAPAPAPPPGPAWAAEITVGADLTLRLGAPCSPEFIARLLQHLRRPC